MNPILPFCKSVDNKKQCSRLSHALGLPDYLSPGQEGQYCLLARSDLMTPSDPSSSTPGPPTSQLRCHVLIDQPFNQ